MCGQMTNTPLQWYLWYLTTAHILMFLCMPIYHVCTFFPSIILYYEYVINVYISTWASDCLTMHTLVDRSYWFMKWRLFGAKPFNEPMTSFFFGNLWNTCQWNFVQIFPFTKIRFQNVVCKMSTVWFRPQWVKSWRWVIAESTGFKQQLRFS